MAISDAAVAEAERHLQNARQHQPHEEGEGQQQHHAHAAVLGPLDAPHEAEGDAEEEHERHERAAGHERELHLYADQRPENGRHHGQGKHHEGIAQDPVLLQGKLAAGLAGHLKLGLHLVPPMYGNRIRH
jgi:hypothetical protein